MKPQEPKCEMPPEVERQSVFACLDAIINLDQGLSALGVINEIVRLCQAHRDETYLLRKDNCNIANAKSSIDLLCLQAQRGTPIRILIGGETYSAQRLARKIYSGLTSEKTYEPDFQRFEW